MKTKTYIRLLIVQPHEVLNYLPKKGWPIQRMYHGVMVDMRSLRYQVFEQNMTCVKCLRSGMYFALESHARGIRAGTFHFNLYTCHPKGGETMFTKDHIIPRALGGTNDLNNLQVLCEVCNRRKGKNIWSPQLVAERHQKAIRVHTARQIVIAPILESVQNVESIVTLSK